MNTSTRPELGAPPRLDFAVLGAEVDPLAATPSIGLEVAVTGSPAVEVRAAMLEVQVRIDARRRSYDDPTRERLREVFGAPAQWAESLRSLLWAELVATVPPFAGRTIVTVPLPCTYDFEVAAAKVLHGLRDGHVPLELLFRGTIFYADDESRLRTARIPWDGETRFDLPVARWREAIDRFFPGSAWLRLDRDLFDRLYAFRNQEGLPSWEATLAALLDREDDR